MQYVIKLPLTVTGWPLYTADTSSSFLGFTAIVGLKYTVTVSIAGTLRKNRKHREKLTQVSDMYLDIVSIARPLAQMYDD